MTLYQLEMAGLKNFNRDNLDAYKKAIEEEDSIADKASLQTLVSDVNEREALKAIQDYAENDDASNLTVYQLERTGLENVRGYLESYKDVIEEKDSINSKKALQTLVENVNKEETLKIIQRNVENDRVYNLKVEQLEIAGVENVTKDNLETYKTAIANEGSIADLEALQTVVNTVNNASLFEKTKKDYDFIKIGDKLYDVDSSSQLPYYMGETETNDNKYVTSPSEIDITKNSSDELEIDGGFFLLLRLGAEDFNIEETENEYLDGKITFDNPYGMTKKELEENTDFSIGYEKHYESATEVVKDKWIEYNGNEFRNPTEYNDKFPHMIEYNDVPFFVDSEETRYVDPDVSINDVFEYLGMNAKISFGKDKDRKGNDFSYLEIKYN